MRLTNYLFSTLNIALYVKNSLYFQLKGLDADVLALSRLLAVRTLQLEMEHVYRSLEDEALDMMGYESSVGDEGESRLCSLPYLKPYVSLIRRPHRDLVIINHWYLYL